MKYLALVVLVIVIATGCVKQKQTPTEMDILTGTTWHISYLMYGAIPSTGCALTEQLTFNKDSTGNHFFSVPCDSTQPNNMPFTWYVEENTTIGEYYTGNVYSSTLYFKNIDSKDSTVILRLRKVDADSIEMDGVVNGGENFIAIYTSTK